MTKRRDRNFTIDEEFQSFIQPLTPMEREQLCRNLLRDGCRDPVVVWAEERILIDGHNRVELCEEHGFTYQQKALSFADRESVLDWIIDNQLGRRNLTKQRAEYLRGKRLEQQPRGGRDRPGIGKTSTRIGRETGTCGRTVERNRQFCQTVDVLAKTGGHALRGKLLSGEVRITSEQQKAILALPIVQRARVAKAISEGRPIEIALPKPPVNRPLSLVDQILASLASIIEGLDAENPARAGLRELVRFIESTRK